MCAHAHTHIYIDIKFGLPKKTLMTLPCTLHEIICMCVKDEENV